MRLPAGVFAGVVCLAPAFAHHSFEAQYDARKPILLQGKVTKVDWMNPHIYVHVDGVDEKGIQGVWMCEGGNPNTLRRNGWKRDTLKPGDQVTVEGSRAKDGTNTCNARAVRLAGGTRVLAGSSGGRRRAQVETF